MTPCRIPDGATDRNGRLGGEVSTNRQKAKAMLRGRRNMTSSLGEQLRHMVLKSF